jgi:hypothetical protein
MVASVTIVLFIVLALPGQKPAVHHEVMPTVEDCITAVADILRKGMEGEYSVQAGCVIQKPKREGT